jgi:hypothetical protein
MYLYVRAERASTARDSALEKTLDYDITNPRPIDPALVHYHSASTQETALRSARSISVDAMGDVILVGGRTLQFTAPGQSRKEWDLNSTANAACASDNAVYVAMKDHVEVFGSDGAPKAVWPDLGDGAYLTGIAAAGDHVFVADSGRRMVVHTDRFGKVTNEIGRADPARGIPGLLLPSPYLGVAVAADGTIWVNDAGRHRMENYTPDGTLERYWGEPGPSVGAFSGCCNPAGFAILQDGSFVTAEKGVPLVKRYLADGRFDSVVAAPSAFSAGTSSIQVAVDAKDRVLVLERGSGTVHVFVTNREVQQ